MNGVGRRMARGWMRLAPKFLPFADAATPDLPLSRLLRLSLFQITVGMAAVLLNGTLNRVMIVELSVPAWLVSGMVALPLVCAPFRALVGFRSDTYRSALGWRRVPFIWIGSLLQFGGLAIMPFALIILSGDTNGPIVVGQIAAALAFLLLGAGFHTTQTTGLALATDVAAPETRPRVVALMYVMLLVGVVVSALIYGAVLRHFSELRLIQVIQGSAVITIVLNGIALWKQEPRNPTRLVTEEARPAFRDSWREFTRNARATRYLVMVGIGTMAFNMQDILLEPYGGQVLHLSVSATTQLTALIAVGALFAFAVAARLLARGADPIRLTAHGATLGLLAFALVMFAAPLDSAALFRCGAGLIGFSGGLFAVGTLTAAMSLHCKGFTGLALGAWGAAQAFAAGVAIALSGALRDVIANFAAHGVLGPALTGPAVGYCFVYLLEIVLLFATLVAIGPLVRPANEAAQPSTFSLAEFRG
jgi:MFS transporter, BCD family, chlorophyll transporter